MLPTAAGASTEVLDADNSVLGELFAQPPSPPEPEVTANDSNPNSAGMQSMTSNTTGNSTAAVCSQNAYILPLQLGQSDFQIVVTPPEPVEQVTKHAMGFAAEHRIHWAVAYLPCSCLWFTLPPFPIFGWHSHA